MSEDMQEPRRVLEDLVRRPVANVEDAEVVAEASRLLRDLLRLEEQVRDLLDRTAEGDSSVGERAARYAARGFQGLTLHEAAHRVLVAVGVPMHVKDLGARIKAAGWRHPRARRPRPDQIEFQLAARLPRFPDLFRRVAPNTFGLAEWGDASVPSRKEPSLKTVRGRGPKLARRIGDEPDLVFREEPRWRSS